VALPAGLREHGWSQRHINIGVGLMGLNWVGAALAAACSCWFYVKLMTPMVTKTLRPLNEAP